MKILGIITARGGSKRLPGKNIKNLCGKPLLGWTIEVARKSDVLDRIILTTDDEEIAEVGGRFGAEIPFMRPKKLAEDESTSYEAVKHAVDWLKENEKYEVDWIILFEPTAPGRTEDHVREVANLIKKDGDFDSIVSITKTPGHYSYQKQLKISTDSLVSRITDGMPLSKLTHRNQDVTESYYINSALYAFRTDNLYDGTNSLWGERTYGYKMDEKYSFDIDTPEDWTVAEVKMRILTSFDS